MSDGCSWCGESLDRLRRDAKFCSQRCRQASHRFGSACVSRRRATEPLELAYADPPYPGKAERYYSDHPDFGGEVDHRELLSHLQGFDGWALSTSAEALPLVLWLCVEQRLEVRVGSWHRGARPTRTRWPLRAWEPVVYAGGRRLVMEPSEAPLDVLEYVSRPRTTDPERVVGAKPAPFAYWLFDLMGARPGDRLHDLYPGSGGIARAWERFEAVAPRGDDASQPGSRDASREYSNDG